MLKNKKYLFLIIFIKFTLLVNFSPRLEVSRYSEFFNQCTNMQTCLNPYNGITDLELSFLSFPYSSLMYFIVLPFYFIANIFQISFVNLTYFVFELLLINVLKRAFGLNSQTVLAILILNPILIYSAGILGQLDFIPLTLFLYSLFEIKIKNKYKSLFFLILSLSSKIIFIVLLPIVLFYFIKYDQNKKEILKTYIFTISIMVLLNSQLFIDQIYQQTVLYGINRGFDVIQGTENIFTNTIFLIGLIYFFTLFMYWKNIHRLDFIGVCIFTGFITLPLYITNLSNIGWLLWSYPSFVILFHSFGYKIKFFINLFFILSVTADYGNNHIDISVQYLKMLNFLIYLSGIIIFYYLIELIKENKFFKIKSSAVIIAISGDSAVGKSTLTESLKQYLGIKFVNSIELDSFHKYERDNPVWKKKTHLNPDMNNLIEFKNIILNLINGKTEIVRNYNHLTGKFDSEQKQSIKNYLILEGLHSLYFQDLNKKYNLNIFLDLDKELKAKTKINRDKDRGKTKELVLEEISKRRQDFMKYILPQKNYADLYIKTLERGTEYQVLEVALKSDYFYALEEIIGRTSDVEIMVNKHESYENILFSLKFTKKSSTEIFSKLTYEIKNLKDKYFNFESETMSSEQIVKLGIVLFMLNEKIKINL
jgi:uridine kinase